MELNTNQVILELLNIAIDSGKEIMKIYDKGFTVDTKEDRLILYASFVSRSSYKCPPIFKKSKYILKLLRLSDSQYITSSFSAIFSLLFL